MNEREQRMKRWASIHKLLNEAMEALMPELIHCGKVNQIEDAKEYLEHNELGLAWEELEKVGDCLISIAAKAAFWRPMAKAAGVMLEGFQDEASAKG